MMSAQIIPYTELLLIFLWFSSVTLHYTIHESCDGETRQKVKNAADKALVVLRYAQFCGQWSLGHSLPVECGDKLTENMLGGDSGDGLNNAIRKLLLSLYASDREEGKQGQLDGNWSTPSGGTKHEGYCSLN